MPMLADPTTRRACMQIRDKVAVVTGGASGIGRALGVALAEKGAHVVVADVEEERARSVAAEITSLGVTTLAVRCDVTSEDSVEALADETWRHFGRCEIVCNNAGVGGGTWLLDSSAKDLRWIFDVNVFGVWHGCKTFGRRFRDQGTEAWILNTGSEHSFGLPHVQSGFYTASKHAVLGLTDVLRAELPGYIGVSILCPGVVATDFWNATRNRPEQYGGSAQPAPEIKAIMEQGKDALEIGRRAVEGIERGDFYILTHPHARAYVDKRHTELSAAFDAQAPMKAGEERYDVTSIAFSVISRMRSDS
jgi:NAD(P)-dependent dehydrogenase (short-subunit alcohol dehydrogenase family)